MIRHSTLRRQAIPTYKGSERSALKRVPPGIRARFRASRETRNLSLDVAQFSERVEQIKPELSKLRKPLYNRLLKGDDYRKVYHELLNLIGVLVRDGSLMMEFDLKEKLTAHFSDPQIESFETRFFASAWLLIIEEEFNMTVGFLNRQWPALINKWTDLPIEARQRYSAEYVSLQECSWRLFRSKVAPQTARFFAELAESSGLSFAAIASHLALLILTKYREFCEEDARSEYVLATLMDRMTSLTTALLEDHFPAEISVAFVEGLTIDQEQAAFDRLVEVLSRVPHVTGPFYLLSQVIFENPELLRTLMTFSALERAVEYDDWHKREKFHPPLPFLYDHKKPKINRDPYVIVDVDPLRAVNFMPHTRGTARPIFLEIIDERLRTHFEKITEIYGLEPNAGKIETVHYADPRVQEKRVGTFYFTASDTAIQSEEDAAKLYRRLDRGLKPGGRVVISADPALRAPNLPPQVGDFDHQLIYLEKGRQQRLILEAKRVFVDEFEYANEVGHCGREGIFEPNVSGFFTDEYLLETHFIFTKPG